MKLNSFPPILFMALYTYGFDFVFFQQDPTAIFCNELCQDKGH